MNSFKIAFLSMFALALPALASEEPHTETNISCASSDRKVSLSLKLIELHQEGDGDPIRKQMIALTIKKKTTLFNHGKNSEILKESLKGIGNENIGRHLRFKEDFVNENDPVYNLYLLDQQDGDYSHANALLVIPNPTLLPGAPSTVSVSLDCAASSKNID